MKNWLDVFLTVSFWICLLAVIVAIIVKLATYDVDNGQKLLWQDEMHGHVRQLTEKD